MRQTQAIEAASTAVAAAEKRRVRVFKKATYESLLHWCGTEGEVLLIAPFITRPGTWAESCIRYGSVERVDVCECRYRSSQVRFATEECKVAHGKCVCVYKREGRNITRTASTACQEKHEESCKCRFITDSHRIQSSRCKANHDDDPCVNDRAKYSQAFAKLHKRLRDSITAKKAEMGYAAAPKGVIAQDLAAIAVDVPTLQNTVQNLLNAHLQHDIFNSRWVTENGKRVQKPYSTIIILVPDGLDGTVPKFSNSPNGVKIDGMKPLVEAMKSWVENGLIKPEVQIHRVAASSAAASYVARESGLEAELRKQDKKTVHYATSSLVKSHASWNSRPCDVCGGDPLLDDVFNGNIIIEDERTDIGRRECPTCRATRDQEEGSRPYGALPVRMQRFPERKPVETYDHTFAELTGVHEEPIRQNSVGQLVLIEEKVVSGEVVFYYPPLEQHEKAPNHQTVNVQGNLFAHVVQSAQGQTYELQVEDRRRTRFNPTNVHNWGAHGEQYKVSMKGSGLPEGVQVKGLNNYAVPALPDHFIEVEEGGETVKRKLYFDEEGYEFYYTREYKRQVVTKKVRVLVKELKERIVKRFKEEESIIEIMVDNRKIKKAVMLPTDELEEVKEKYLDEEWIEVEETLVKHKDEGLRKKYTGNRNLKGVVGNVNPDGKLSSKAPAASPAASHRTSWKSVHDVGKYDFDNRPEIEQDLIEVVEVIPHLETIPTNSVIQEEQLPPEVETSDKTEANVVAPAPESDGIVMSSHEVAARRELMSTATPDDEPPF